MKIAVLGLGRMGQALAHRLLDGGHDVAVWNRTKGRAGDLVEAGATEADDPVGAVAGADVVITSLSNDEAVSDLAFGDHGLVEQIGSRIYVDASTISPDLSRKLADSSPRFVAMPILGAPQAVRDGKAIYLAGGDSGVVDDLQPMFESLGSDVKRYDRAEKASTAKLAVNLMLLSGIATLAEAVAVARAGELSDDQLKDLIGSSPMLAPGLKNRFDALVEGSGPAWWTTRLAAKDAGLAIDVAKSIRCELRVAQAVEGLYQAAIDEGFDDDDIVAVARLYR